MNSIMMSILLLQGGSLLISEIMYDPDPVVGLPPYEYAEWYNAGADTVDLAGWQWVVGDKVRQAGSGRISPGGFVIVCSPAAAPAFRALGQVIAMESFPALRNTGERLILVNPAGIAVHTVDYSPGQFTDALKANGGWSLELADLSQACSPSAWMPSADPSGGTPGKPNSRRITLPPPETPRLIRAAGYNDQSFVLLFSGTLNPQLNMNNYACRLMPGDIPAPAISCPEYGVPGLFFHLPEDLDRSLTYTADLAGTVDDCSGREARLRTVQLGFPAEPDSAGVVITEVMFDPQPGQAEFVEVYNRSGRMVDLQGLILARAGAGGGILAFSDQQTLSYWLFPDGYAVFTADGPSFAKAWPSADPAVIAERTDMPALASGESQLILMDRNQKILDRATYSSDWHYPYLDENKGVSLERLDAGAPGTDRANWFSASAASGGATPGAKNSSSVSQPAEAAGKFSLTTAAGYSEISGGPVPVVVSYRFEEAGWFLRMHMYNSAGQPVREIFPFGLASTEGVICWDGLDEEQGRVPDGIYLAVADYYHPSGKRGRWKRACPLLRAY